MKKFLSTSFIAAILLSSISCGGGLPNILTGTDGNGTGTNNGAVDIITGVLGALTNQTSASSIVGSWTYTEPAVQFESDNLLSQIGSSALNKKAESTITKYYEKIGVRFFQHHFQSRQNLLIRIERQDLQRHLRIRFQHQQNFHQKRGIPVFTFRLCQGFRKQLGTYV